MDEFQPIVDDFELGNWIRMRVDGTLYKIYLLGYSLDFNNLQTLQVEFSNVTKAKDANYEASQLFQSAKSMATSYNYVSKQAEKGNAAQTNIEDWIQNGLDTGLIQIRNNNDEEISWGQHGILCRSKDDTTGNYDDKQIKITHNAIAFTDNNWKSVRQAIGEHSYTIYDEEKNDWETTSGYGMTADFVQAGHVSGSTIVGGKIYSTNYNSVDIKDEDGNILEPKAGSFINLDTGEFSFGGDSLYYRDEEFVISDTAIGQSLEGIDIKAENLKIAAANIEGSLPWSQIADKPDILTETEVSNEIRDTVTSDYINSLKSLTIDHAESIRTNELYVDTSHVLNHDTAEYETGVTGTYTIGGKSLRIINGIIVEIIEIQE